MTTILSSNCRGNKPHHWAIPDLPTNGVYRARCKRCRRVKDHPSIPEALRSTALRDTYRSNEVIFGGNR